MISTEKNYKVHSIAESLLLHILPGILIGAVYYLIVPAIERSGYPSVMALVVTAVFVLVPVELGVLLWQAQKRHGKLSLRGIVIYQQKLSLWQYLLWVPVIFAASGLIMTLLNPISTAMANWFDWIPEPFRLDMGFSTRFSREKLIWTYVLHFVFIIFIAPTVEEFYFRGFLLPRMPKEFGGLSPIAHSFLFALYHTWSPWMFLARTLALLPLIYIVQWKRNLYLGMFAHWLINSIDFVMGVIFIMQMG